MNSAHATMERNAKRKSRHAWLNSGQVLPLATTSHSAPQTKICLPKSTTDLLLPLASTRGWGHPANLAHSLHDHRLSATYHHHHHHYLARLPKWGPRFLRHHVSVVLALDTDHPATFSSWLANFMAPTLLNKNVLVQNCHRQNSQIYDVVWRRPDAFIIDVQTQT